MVAADGDEWSLFCPAIGIALRSSALVMDLLVRSADEAAFAASVAGENTVSAGGTVEVPGAVAGPIADGIAVGTAVGSEFTRGSGGEMRSLSQPASATTARQQAARIMGVGIAFPFQEG